MTTYSSNEAAEALGVSRKTINEYVRKGVLTAQKKGIRGILRFEGSDLQRFALDYGMSINLPEKQE